MEIRNANTAEESIVFLKMTGRALVTKRSGFTGKYHTATLTLTDDQYSDWLAGALIQNVLPHLTAEEREFLMTGITPQEWNETFKD